MYAFDEIKKADSEIADAIQAEMERQNSHLELIASENWVSKAVMAAMGSPLTNKYAEGYPGKRYYGGCQCVDVVEDLARERAKKLFGCDYANVQPHSGAQANMAVFMAMLEAGDTVMGMSLDCGGHLTHGSPVNFSGKYFHIVPYGVNDEGYIDYDEVEKLAMENKPKLIVAGASAYARVIDFKRFREIADKCGAYLMVDMAHIAGLVAAGLHPSPIPYADVVTTTTHKTLRGPRGGLILANKEAAEKFNFNKAIFPGTQGGPLMHVIAGKAVCFLEASKPEFQENMRLFHNAGNLFVRSTINRLFHSNIKDIMTGYRAFSYRFVKTFPVLSQKFEIETEMSIHAIDKHLQIENLAIDYKDRPTGSESKLNTYFDGFRILKTILNLYHVYRPLAFFGAISCFLSIIGCILMVPVLKTYFLTGLVPRFPTLIVSGYLLIAALQLFCVGLTLQTILKKNRQDFELELYRVMEQEKRTIM